MMPSEATEPRSCLGVPERRLLARYGRHKKVSSSMSKENALTQFHGIE
jgi:hypothetical protein